MHTPHLFQQRRVIVLHPVGDKLHILVNPVNNTQKSGELSHRSMGPNSFLSTELHSVRWPSISNPLTNMGRKELWVNDTAVTPEEVASDALHPIKELLSVTNKDVICMIHPTDWDRETISTLDTSLRNAGITSTRIVHVSRATCLLYAPGNDLGSQTTISDRSYAGPTLIYTHKNYAEVTFTEEKIPDTTSEKLNDAHPLGTRKNNNSSLFLPTSTISGPFSSFTDLKKELPKATLVITGGDPSAKEEFLTVSHLNSSPTPSQRNDNLENSQTNTVTSTKYLRHVDDNQMLEGALRYLYARKLVDKPSKQLPVIGRSSNFKRLAAGLLSILATFGGVMTLMSFKKATGPDRAERISTENPYSIFQNSTQKLDCRMIYQQLPLDIAARSHVATSFENIQQANENTKDRNCSFFHVDDGFNDHYGGRPLLVTGGDHSVVSSIKNGKLTEDKDYGDFYGWHQRKISMPDADAPAIFSEHGDNSHGYLRFVTAMNAQNTDVLGIHRTAIRGFARLGGHAKVSQGGVGPVLHDGAFNLDTFLQRTGLAWSAENNLWPLIPDNEELSYPHLSGKPGKTYEFISFDLVAKPEEALTLITTGAPVTRGGNQVDTPGLAGWTESWDSSRVTPRDGRNIPPHSTFNLSYCISSKQCLTISKLTPSETSGSDRNLDQIRQSMIPIAVAFQKTFNSQKSEP
ncbi:MULTISPECIES: hypothetical protein [Corynebacterium]|uniref:hypothetical protein n=2 Tax=Corynebacteriaceae TaxID=1653 RepID=UPI000A4F0B6A|nr:MULTISPECIES: hypothetical protein [Corynebacterium]MBY0797320.1 hypothetical protein [Corynebacterium parakroppenstedtii]MCF6785674.1 hypothetical protein [Corynebacterium parakroppenstedtii]MCF6792286.1 hypothetical protein [Corynebacterium parakroppenstedtii]MCF6818822.1 hypothetical protein [Corynebacterium parakroppenstedtii]MCF6820901.1 hypothetical protein [Corynebacterium parakroppenstedtii]